jgi:uncharacterized protein YehS (DUF1456 family)
MSDCTHEGWDYTQEKLFRFVNLNQLDADVDMCDKKFEEAGYKFVPQAELLSILHTLIEREI